MERMWLRDIDRTAAQGAGSEAGAERIKLTDEEEVMLNQFPARYPAYQALVKRLIPFVL